MDFSFLALIAAIYVVTHGLIALIARMAEHE